MEKQLYDRIGDTYKSFRTADPRIAACVNAALGDAQRIVNVGAGAGSYEPIDRYVIAVEPSDVMIAQRTSSSNVVKAAAESLPFRDAAFDAALASLTVHHWSKPAKGLAEMSRVAPRRVVVGFEPAAVIDFWLMRDYLPQGIEWVLRNPSTAFVAEHLGGSVRIEPIPIPADCADGFLSAYWNRPEMYLRHDVRNSISLFRQMPRDQIDEAMRALRSDLESGVWDQRNGDLRHQSQAELGHRIIISQS